MKKESSRTRQKETITQRYGPDFFRTIAKMRLPVDHLGRWASWHRWYPDRFNADGTLKKEWEKEFYATTSPKT